MKQWRTYWVCTVCLFCLTGCGGGSDECNPLNVPPRCSGAKTLTYCTQDRQLVDIPCPSGCDSKTNSCIQKTSSTCKDADFPVCDESGYWSLTCANGVAGKTQCPYRCNKNTGLCCKNQACTDEVPCTAETYPDKCLDGRRLQYCEDGERKVRTCMGTCEKDACVDVVCTDETYATMCIADGDGKSTKRQLCNCGTEDNPLPCFSVHQNGKKTIESCEFGCMTGTRVDLSSGEVERDYCAECDPETFKQKCDANNRLIKLTCGSDRRIAGELCLDGKGYCKDDTELCVEFCTPGAARCQDGNTLEWCNQGIWEVMTCPKGCGKITKWGMEVDGCYPCGDDYHASCANDHASQICQNHDIVKVQCDDGCDVRTGLCKPCTLDAHRCFHGEIQKCMYSEEQGKNVWGTDPDAPNCLDQGGVCNLSDPTTCVFPCNLGTKSCDGNKLRECVNTADGLAWDDANATDCTSLGEDVYCDADNARCAIRPTGVGQPCECDGPNCATIVTGNQFNSVITYLAVSAIGWSGADYASFPNFWGANEKTKIYGCDALQQELPPGMAVGCFRNGEFDITDNAKSQMTNLKNIGCAYKEGVCEFITKISDTLNSEVKVSVPNGYCFVGAMNVDFSFSQTSGAINYGLEHRGRDLVELADSLLDVGKVSDVTTSTVCPMGTVLISDIAKNVEFGGYGDMQMQMAMCLQKCLDDADCRTEDGYKCLKWHNQNVCFFEETIKNLHNLEAGLGLSYDKLPSEEEPTE